MRYSTAARGNSCFLAGFAQIFLDLVGDKERFILAIRSFVVANLRAALARGPKILALALRVARDHRADAPSRIICVER